MSMKFEIADWRFELTWREMVCTPVDQDTLDRSKAEEKPEFNNRNSLRPAFVDGTNKPTTQQAKRREKRNELD
ncbi:MAG: hypothetical protein ACRD9Y_29005 [Blastocatellia bacterium]